MYVGLNFSHVKFYHDLSAGLKNLPRKPQNFGDIWPLASTIEINSFAVFHEDKPYKNEIIDVELNWLFNVTIND